MNIDTGVCDTSIVENVLEEISQIALSHYNSFEPDGRWDKMKYILIKSTVPPGTTRELDVKYGGPNTLIGFCPEFLTEADADMDMLNQDRVVLGVDSLGGNTIDEHDTRWMDGEVESSYWSNPGETIGKFFKSLYHPKRRPTILITTPEEAELCKYFTNCFLATKVSLMNEFKQIADAHDRGWRRSSIYGRDPDSTWHRAIEAMLLDPRIGNSHTRVPGPDGQIGFSGSCFPKDVNSLINIAEGVNVNPRVLKATWQKNLEVRPERDWERLEGRAVTKAS
jgi:UDPglucose 6-dehydrogenase